MVEQRVTFAPTEEQELIRSTARQFLRERLPLDQVRELMMSDSGFDHSIWKEMASLGWTGLTIAEEHGGAGMGPVELGVLMEEMGRLVTPGPFFASSVLATTAIQEIATDSQQADCLPGLASGETIATVAMFESRHGWANTPKTTATESDAGWVIAGEKRTVLDGLHADLILVTASTTEGVGLFVVDPAVRGVTIEPESSLDLTRRTATVELSDVELGPDARLGSGDAGAGLEHTLRLATIALAAEQVGGTQACMEQSVEYAKSRYQFGRPIGSYQSIKHRCANMLMKLEHARSAAYYASRVTEDATELGIAAPLAGSIASETYTWVAGENIQVHGGIGFTWEHDAHLYLKRAKSSSLLLGSARHHRDLLGRAVGI